MSLRIEGLPIDALQDALKNPKLHSDQIENSIGRFGYVEPIVLDERTNRIVAGHGRKAALLKLKSSGGTPPDGVVVNENGDWIIPVIRGWWSKNDKEAEAYLIASNRLVELGGWDEKELVAMMSSFQSEDLLSGVGYTQSDITEMLSLNVSDVELSDAEPQIDRADELRKEWKVETGQLWEFGEHRLLCGDTTKAEDVQRLFGKDLASIIVTDPPYGVSYASKNKFLNAGHRGNCIQTPIDGDHQTPDEMSAFWVAAFTAIRESLSPGASYYVTGPQGGDLLLLLLALRQSGFPLRHMLVWVKNNHVLGRCDYHYKHEPILYGWVDGSHKFYGDASQFSTWEIDKPHKSDLHPTMKPVELYLRALSNSSKAGDVVAEPFCGSGTSLIACEQLGRKCRAIEINPGYVAVALQRFKDATGKEPNLLTDAR